MEIIKSLCTQPTKQVVIKKFNVEVPLQKLINKVPNQDGDVEDQSENYLC